MRDLVIVGAGGFGRETIDTVRAINQIVPSWRLLGVVDDALSPNNESRLAALGVAYLGPLGSVPDDAAVAIAVGSPTTRAVILQRLGGGFDFPALVHPSTTIGGAFSHGVGLITLAGVSIGTNVRVGDHVHLNAHAVMGHDTVASDFVSINPNATVSGAVQIGEGVLVGAASVILQGVSIAPRATVGAGACVVKDVGSHRTVKGVPAR